VNDRPLVSIVLPTFQQADFLAAALCSVVAQDYEHWEAIVVDNHSTDHTIDIVNSVGDPRIRRVDFANHGVIAASRNHGIELATGELIAFLDSDDEWLPAKLRRCVSAMSDGAELVCHSERWVGGAKADRVVHYGPAERATYERLLLDQNCISTSAVVVRASTLAAVGGFDTRVEFTTAEDYDLWLRLARRGTQMAFLPEVLGTWRRHDSSASAATDRHLAAELAVVDAHLVAGRFPRRRARRRIARCHYTAGRGHHARGDKRAAVARLARSLSIYPFTLRPWIALGVLALPGRPR
jgi:teichuronic acid biosynthesis glycosyltransferase TuaG